MKVRMLVELQGLRNGEDWPAVGETVDLPKGEADKLVGSGAAEPVRSESKRSSASAK
jgi:hypothetical protein